MRLLHRHRDGGAAKERTIRDVRLRLSDEIGRVTEWHASSWDEACAELMASGFTPRAAAELVRTNFVGIGWDVDTFRIDVFGAEPGMLLVPRGIAASLAGTADELRSRVEAVLRHPAGTAAEEHLRAS